MKKENLAKRKITEEELRENVSANLLYYMKCNGCSQRELAESLGIAAATMNRIIKKTQTPTLFPLGVRGAELLGCSLDDFAYLNLEKVRTVEEAEKLLQDVSLHRMHSIYVFYYYDNSGFKGRERHSSAKALKSGILIVEDESKTREMKAAAIFGMRKEEAEQAYQELRNIKGFRNLRKSMKECAGRQWEIYEGSIDLSENYIFLFLESGVNDKILAIFNRPDNHDLYIGGLAAAASVSRGCNRNPCMQVIGLTYRPLPSAKEEIADHLLMHYPAMKSYESVDDLMSLIQRYYSSDEASFLSEEEKQVFIRNMIDNMITSTVEKNLMRSVAVTNQDDDDFYHYIKYVLKLK